MEDYLQKLKDRVLSEGVLDSETIHHEFVSGMHGRKIDMDKIETGSDFYMQWMDASVKYIKITIWSNQMLSSVLQTVQIGWPYRSLQALGMAQLD